MNDASFTFRLEVGILNREATVFEIKSACMKVGLRCDLAESRGLLESEYQFKISGPAKTLGKFRERLMSWLDQ